VNSEPLQRQSWGVLVRSWQGCPRVGHLHGRQPTRYVRREKGP